MNDLWTFEFEATDRKTWPVLWGRVTVLANDYDEAFLTAFGMVYGFKDLKDKRRRSPWLPKIEMVTALHCVDWPEEET